MSVPDTGGATSVPPYPFRHSGPVLVCGSAWCLLDDVRAAEDRFPDAAVIAVNGAAGEIKARLLFTLHPAKMPVWAARQRERFGSGFSTHTAQSRHALDKPRAVPQGAEYVWSFPGGQGTSAWAARRLARILGFSPVVLCGVPLSPGPYMSGLNAKMFGRAQVLDGYRRFIAQDTSWHGDVFGMSGWPREFFGAP